MLPDADAAVGTVGCDQAEVEGMMGRMPRLLEAGVAVGADCKFYDTGDAIGCSSVVREELLGDCRDRLRWLWLLGLSASTRFGAV